MSPPNRSALIFGALAAFVLALGACLPTRDSDSCRWAEDGSCDERTPARPFGLCEPGTDTTDCFGSSDQVCSDSCTYAGDGTCDDGGTGSEFSVCDYGTDCSDCGPR